MPVLLLVGEHEIFYNPQATLVRARRLLPNLEAEMLLHVGHALPMEQPGIVDARILQFLGQGREPESAAGSAQPRVAVTRLPIGQEA